jgi:hypothetical protein
MTGLITTVIVAWVIVLIGKALLAKYAPEQYEKMIAAEERKKQRNHKMLGLGMDIVSKLLKK